MSCEESDREEREKRTPTRELEPGKRGPLDKQTAAAPKQGRGERIEKWRLHKVSRGFAQMNTIRSAFIRVNPRPIS
jgi:hypothetical protein